MLALARYAVIAILLALASTVHALHVPRGINPWACHFVFSRFEDAKCGLRFPKDLERKKEKQHGTAVHINVCQSWDGRPFRGYSYGWQSCTFYQEPWRREMGNCNMTLFTNPECDATGKTWFEDRVNTREVLDAKYKSKCLSERDDDTLPYRSVIYSCEEPGYVAGH